MTYFSPNLYHNTKLRILYLPFGDHPKAWIQNEFQNVIYVLLLKNLFLKIDNEL
jgi:hypothetical protein